MAGSVVRTFETGANRDLDEGKLDFDGFLSPLVIERFGEYMNKNRFLRDGSVRDSDNWQKGIPFDVYMKSGWRHFFHWWKLHRGPVMDFPQFEEALCGLLFNTMGYLHETIKLRHSFEEGAKEAEECRVEGCPCQKAQCDEDPNCCPPGECICTARGSFEKCECGT